MLAETDEGLEPLKLPEKPDFSQAAAKAAGRSKRKTAEKPGAEQGPRVLYGKRIQEKDRIPQDQVSEDVGRVVIGGEITSLEVKETKNGAFIINFAISDHTNTLPCKLFIKAKEAGQKLQAELEATKKQGDWLLVQGDYTMDEFMRRMCVHVGNIGAFSMPKRMDTAPEKRVELHLHTKMSTMDGLTNVKEAVATAARWGHRAIAITDHGVVHAFPDAVSAADKLTKGGQEIKAILGVEGYLLPDCRLVERPETYIALGVTSAPAFRLDDLFEIAALRTTAEGEVLDTFYRVVDCGALLPPELAQETGLTQEQLAHVRLPLGGLHKTEVREIAEKQHFINARKHDSQDICFVPDGDYARFMEDFTGRHYPAGDFLDENGKKVGTHNGAVRYTIGQRTGLGLAMGAPVYVCAKDMQANTVTVGPEENLFDRIVYADEVNWIAIPELTAPLRVTARTRYHQTEQAATVYPAGEGQFRLEFDQPQRAPTPGQAVVLYQGDVVLGGGTIVAVE